MPETQTDKELLAKAAKTAGAQWTDHSDRTPDHWQIKHADGIWREWKPLDDDGDALRLAVKIKTCLDIEPFEAVAYYAPGEFVREEPTMGYSLEEATRRAIVKAAAAMQLGR